MEASIEFLTAEGTWFLLLHSCKVGSTLLNFVEGENSTGEQNWSLDLISGLPNLTVAEWEHNLCKAVSFSPPHISVYDLQV